MPPTHRTSVGSGLLPRVLLLVLVGVVAAVLVAATWALGREGPSAPWTAAEPAAPAEASSAAGLAVLRDWDRRRARAWAEGDVAGLAALYTARSAAGRRDVAALRRWQHRGLRVEGLRLQVLRGEVVEHASERLVLDVVDRVVGGQAVGRGRVRALPVDAPSSRRIVWVREGGAWRVAAVRAR